MKHVFVCLAVLTVAVFLFGEVSAGQWYQQNSGTTKKLNAVQLLDANNGWVVGDSGLIIHTTNGGVDWILQASGTTNNLLSVLFIDANTGTVVGDQTILRTTNGGASWTLQQPGVYNFRLQSVFFINSNIGTAVGGKPSMIDWMPLILRTTNGGENWIEQTIEMAFVLSKASGTDGNQGIPVPLYGVCFTDTNTGTIVGRLGILHTTNGGNNWTRNASDTTSFLCSVCFTDANNGTMVGLDGIIRRTTNGGIDWILQSSGTTNWLYSVCFTDANTGTAVGWDGIILRTTNGGIDWILQSSGTEIITLNGVSFTDANTGTAVGYDGTILRTTTGGISFVDDRTTEPTECILEQNYPNPFNPNTTITYELPKASEVRVSVFDMLGREVSVLVNEKREVGVHEVTFDGSTLASGVYFYRLQAGDFIQTKRLVVLK